MIVACHYDPQSRRSAYVATVMSAGALAIGLKAQLVPNFREVCGDVGIAYGWANPGLFEAYRAAGGHYVYVDLGWWNRKPGNDVLGGYHKVVVDGREPGPYFRRNSPGDRFAQLKIKIAPWRQGGNHILVAGMSEKSARTRGYAPQQWETAAIRNLQQIYPTRPILYRPKPSWTGATPIIGAAYSSAIVPLEDALRGAWAAVSCHSNVAVDALVAGVPIYVEGGVALEASVPLERLGDAPETYHHRASLMADIAYCQWTPYEMAHGACLRHLLEHTPLCA